MSVLSYFQDIFFNFYDKQVDKIKKECTVHHQLTPHSFLLTEFLLDLNPIQYFFQTF